MSKPTDGFPDESWTYHNDDFASMPLVGREQELARLTEAIQRGLNVVVTGPWGSGKTSLVRMALEASQINLLKVEWISAFRFTQPEKLIDRIENATRRGMLVILDDLDRVESGFASQIVNSAFRRDGRRFIIITNYPLLPDGTHAVAGQDFVHVELGSISEADALRILERYMASAEVTISHNEITEIVRRADGDLRLLLHSANLVLQRKPESFGPEPRLVLTLNAATLDTDLVVDLLTALNELYRALGGEGLEIEDGETREYRVKGALV